MLKKIKKIEVTEQMLWRLLFFLDIIQLCCLFGMLICLLVEHFFLQ